MYLFVFSSVSTRIKYKLRGVVSVEGIFHALIRGPHSGLSIALDVKRALENLTIGTDSGPCRVMSS